MTDLLSMWVRGIIGVSLLSAAALAVTPKGRVHGVLRFACALATILVMLQPLLRLDPDSYAENLALYREEYASLGAAAREDADRLTRTIIEDECAAYILDKANALGVPVVRASVRAHWSGESWVPYEAEVTLHAGADGSALARAMEAELGIPRERQEWSEA